MADEKDDLLGDIRAAMGEQPAETVERPEIQQEQPAEQAQPTPGERARDESGRFAAKDKSEQPRETLSLKEKPQAVAAPEAAGKAPDSAAAPAAPEPGKSPVAPPSTWKGDAKVRFDRLPPEIQAGVRADHEALVAERAAIAPFRELIDSHKDLLVRESGSVDNGMRELFAFARLSVDNPLALIQHIARARGLNLGAAFQGQPQQQAPQQQPQDFDSRLKQAVQAELQPHLAQFAQQRSQPVLDLLSSAASNPKYPYWNDVAPTLEHYIQAEKVHLAATQPGKSFSPEQILDGAYNRATWADTTIRAQLQGAQAEEAKKTQAAEAQRARQAAAASLRGSPLPGAAANGTGNSNASVHDDVRAAMAELTGA